MIICIFVRRLVLSYMLSFGELLKNVGDPTLAEIQRHTSMLRKLQMAIDQQIGTALAVRCRVINLRESTLVLSAGTPVLAAKIRHSSARILHAVQALGKIDRIQVKIICDPTPEKPPLRRRQISENALQSIESAADSVRDPELAESFRRLAARHRD